MLFIPTRHLRLTMDIQTDTLIVWTEPDGVDYALSFQEPEGCAEVWNFIQEVQRHMSTFGESQAKFLLKAVF